MFQMLFISALVLTSLLNVSPNVKCQSIDSEDFQASFDNNGEFSLQSHNIHNEHWNFKWNNIVELDENLRPLNKGRKLDFNRDFDVVGFNEVADLKKNITSSTVRWSITEPSYDVYIDNTIYSDAIDVEYANTTIHVPSGSLKFSITIPRWRFSDDAKALMLKININYSQFKKQIHTNESFRFEDNYDVPKSWNDFEHRHTEDYNDAIEKLESRWKNIINQYVNMNVCSEQLFNIVYEIMAQLNDDVEKNGLDTLEVYGKVLETVKSSISTIQCEQYSFRPQIPLLPFTNDAPFHKQSLYVSDHQEVEGESVDDMKHINSDVKRAEWGQKAFIDFPNSVVVDGQIVKTIVKMSGNTIRIVIPRFERYAYYDPVTGIEDNLVSSSDADDKYINSDIVYIMLCVILFMLL